MRTHVFLGGFCLLASSILNTQAAKLPPAVLEIGNRKQLFIDDYMIQSLTDARQVLNTATKAPNNPVIKPDRPWEGSLSPVAKVMYDEDKGLFKMWYSTTQQWKAERGGQLSDYHWTEKGSVRERVDAAYQYVGDHNEYTYRLCFATSKDGFNWEKPDLGKVEFNGSRSNNILPKGSRAPTFLDPNEKDPAKRYKAIGHTRSKDPPGMQLHLYYSPDGFEWTAEPDNPVMDTTPEPGRWGPTHYMGWDPIRRVYAAHIENCLHRKCPLGVRMVGRAESPDLKSWSLPQNIIVPDERDHIDSEFYLFPVVTYEGTYIGLPWIFRTTNTLHYPTLAFGRDGVHYDRRFREPLIRPGDEGSFDTVSLYVQPPIMHGGKVWIYYTGANWRGPEQLFLMGDSALRAPALATLPEDGFVSIDAGKLRPGVLLTQSFSFKGSNLWVNLEPARHNDGSGVAEIKVEILDHQTQPIAGFSLDDSDRFTKAGRFKASWGGQSDLSSLAGRPLQLRFWIRNAKLYSFQFE